jgi:hypothetical protein
MYQRPDLCRFVHSGIGECDREASSLSNPLRCAGRIARQYIACGEERNGKDYRALHCSRVL